MKIPAAILLACAISQAPAQQLTPAVSSIRVIGSAVVTAKPDRGRIDVGVQIQAQQSQAAAAQNARQLDAVIAALHKILGAGADIRTISYSLTPDYQYHPNGGQPTINGYTASNVVRVTSDDLSKVGALIDAASQSGANRVESVQFTLRDPEAVRAQALREAALKARADAEALASALDLKILRVLTVEESPTTVVPMSQVMFKREASTVSTPIQPGTIDVTANVTLTVEVGPR